LIEFTEKELHYLYDSSRKANIIDKIEKKIDPPPSLRRATKAARLGIGSRARARTKNSYLTIKKPENYQEMDYNLLRNEVYDLFFLTLK